MDKFLKQFFTAKGLITFLGFSLIFTGGIALGIVILFLPVWPLLLYTKLSAFIDLLVLIFWWGFMSGIYAWFDHVKDERDW